jgi:Ran GTPase-activating protein 1
MVPFLSTNQSITTFKLNNNGLGPTGGNIIASAILSNAQRAKSEGRTSKLKVIVCGRNRLENGSAAKWGQAFAELGGLVEIRMPQNGIRMEGIEDIVKGLGKCKGLEMLDLQDNTATKSGTRAIVRQLPNWPELKVLNLSDCLISSAGGIALATALGKGENTKLQSLKLQYGEFDGRTVELLAVAVAQCLKGLNSLELNGNRFQEDDDCVMELKKALEANGHEDALDDCEVVKRGVVWC